MSQRRNFDRLNVDLASATLKVHFSLECIACLSDEDEFTGLKLKNGTSAFTTFLVLESRKIDLEETIRTRTNR